MKKILAIISFLLISNTAFASFSDVPENHPNFSEISYLESQAIVKGYEDGEYKGFKKLNRAEFLKFAIESFSSEFSNTEQDYIALSTAFSDIDFESWYSPYLSFAYKNNWINGYTDNTFRPSNTVTYAEALKMLAVLAEWQVDEQLGSVWHEKYLDYAIQHKIITDTKDSFNAKKELNRAEMANLIYNAIAHNQGFSLIYPEPEIFIDLEVDFYAQAPLGEWSDERQGEGCEEASVLMAVNWANNDTLSDLSSIKAKIIEISKYEESVLGTFHDTSLRDTYEKIVLNYFHYFDAVYRENINIWDIRDALYQAKVVVVPINGQKVYNPYFTYPGPLQHMILIKGYDPETKDFIVHDPGTRSGANFRYSMEELNEAINDYETGNLNYMDKTDMRMIVFTKESFLVMD